MRQPSVSLLARAIKRRSRPSAVARPRACTLMTTMARKTTPLPGAAMADLKQRQTEMYQLLHGIRVDVARRPSATCQADRENGVLPMQQRVKQTVKMEYFKFSNLSSRLEKGIAKIKARKR